MKPLIIIPARGGSKGIPYKNIAPLAGRPLLAYTVDVAREITDTGHIILSTDDEKIAECAAALGLSTDYRRPAELATDTAGSREVILDVMDYAEARGIDYDCIILLQPTSPLRIAEDVRAAMSKFSENIDMVVSVCESTANPYYNLFEETTDGYLEISKGDGLLTRRQDAPKVYEYNGAVYVINPESIRRESMGSFAKKVPSMMPAERSIDIDRPIDLQIADLLLRKPS